MRIVVLNECFLNEDHITRLKKIGDVEIFVGTDTEEKTIERLKGADIALGDCFIAPFNKRVLESTEQLKLLIVNATGFEPVDIETANFKKIKVANVAGYSTESVAELAIGLMFAVDRKIVKGDKIMRVAPFDADPANPEHQKYWGFDLKDKTLGVVGLGRIGTRVAEIGTALGMKVLGYNRTPKQLKGVEMATLEDIFKRSDAISLNLPLNNDTENIISKSLLDLMKSTAILINTGRGKNIVTDDLYAALKENKIAGAGLDVINASKDHPIFQLDNATFTPHIGSATHDAFEGTMPEILVETVEAFLRGKPINIVN